MSNTYTYVHSQAQIALPKIITVGELRCKLCAKTPLYVRSGSYIKQMPPEHLSYTKETLWNTSGRTLSRAEFTHGDYDGHHNVRETDRYRANITHA